MLAHSLSNARFCENCIPRTTLLIFIIFHKSKAGKGYEGISMTKFNNLKVKRVKSNLKYTESKLVKGRPR